MFWLTVTVQPRPGCRVRPGAGWRIELQVKVREDFIFTEKIPSKAFSWLKVSTKAFTFKAVIRHFAKLVRCGIGMPIGALNYDLYVGVPILLLLRSPF